MSDSKPVVRAAAPARVAAITVSDSRTPADDEGGRVLRQHLVIAGLHRVLAGAHLVIDGGCTGHASTHHVFDA